MKNYLSEKQKNYIKMKRNIDIVLSLGAVILLIPFWIGLCLVIKIDSKGPIFFKQKRVGIHKSHFYIYKFRTMKNDTPKDCPTHILESPEQYITAVGKFLRKTSLDELPQLFNIIKGDMSIIGPRPALWNQYDLIEERDKYGANDILPGLTGWAQVHGRDELEIPMKAKLDGFYVKHIGWKVDSRCFFDTLRSVMKSDGVVEGGTGETRIKENNLLDDDNLKKVNEDNNYSKDDKKKILITGAHSYVGTSVENYLKKVKPNYHIDTLEVKGNAWKSYNFISYDVIYHVAGIAHADIGQVSEEEKKLYYIVNNDLAVEVAKKAKANGVKQFIFMSSMIIYGDSAGMGKGKIISKTTSPMPSNFYGDSKWQADQAIRLLADSKFKVVILRPPMIYGNESKGNYQMLVKLAKWLPVFPNIMNQRSMLHIDNLCEFVRFMIEYEEEGIFFPQNPEYTETSKMVKLIAESYGKRIWVTKLLNPFVRFVGVFPGKTKNLIDKAFGNSVYEMDISRYDKGNYQIRNLKQSIEKSKGK